MYSISGVMMPWSAYHFWVIGEVAVVFGFDVAAFVFFDVLAVENPLAAEGGEAFGDVAFEVGVSPRAGAVVDVDGIIFFDHSIGVGGVGEADLTHGNADRFVQVTFDVDTSRVGEDGGVFFESFELGRVVDVFDEVTGVVLALFCVFWCKFAVVSLSLLVWCDHGGFIVLK